MSTNSLTQESKYKKDKLNLLSKKINSIIDKLDLQHLQYLLQGNYIINEDDTIYINDVENHNLTEDVDIISTSNIKEDSQLSNIDVNTKGTPIDISKLKGGDNPIIYFIEFYKRLCCSSCYCIGKVLESNENIEENFKEGLLDFRSDKKERALEVLKLLLQYTSDLNFETNQGQIPLFMAFYENQVDILKLFFQYFLIPKASISKPISTDFFHPSSISKIPLNLNLYNEEWDNILLYTFKLKNELPEPALSFLLLYGMNHCYEQGHILNSTCIDLNAQSWNGNTIVMMAVERNNYHFLKSFFKTIENIHEKALLKILYRCKNNYYHDLIHQYQYLSRSHSIGGIKQAYTDFSDDLKDKLMQDIVQLIMSDPQKIDLEVKDRSLNTALLKAIWSGNMKIIRCLLHHRASTRVHDIHGNTPLMIASILGRAKLVKLLISYGAELNARNKGKTALGFALENNHDEVIYLLRKHQAIE
ncbi:ankyrin [Piromyces finnis]|uniref:Ankyrin n=1 Tax=Piromyces finnis TaxID=1754191 RepID=A0A1Y1UYY5_9FUNG|nr:ankyrin [Piromyces finnis]|eukprot:ORX43618.1 ankyrin [Piromyces finnis]